MEQAEGHLAEPPGEEVVLTRDDKPVARLIRTPNLGRPQPGLGKGLLTIDSDDDAHLNDSPTICPQKESEHVYAKP